CVNRVGVDLNSASYRLLAYVAGIGESLAKHIVQHRFANGAFKHREQLLEVPRFGEKAFQQAAGFLRIREGENPLDASAVHPESYPVVQRICQLTGKTVPELVGNDAVLDGLDPALLIDEHSGLETVKDIIAELKKPGRDPRQRFEAVIFREGVHKPADLEVGMELQGIVTNVTDFGAFVDVGVHQDGLVHLSEISHQYVKNPADALSVGQSVHVKVLAVDLKSKRIGLSIKALLPGGGAARPEGPRPERRPRSDRPRPKAEARPQQAPGTGGTGAGPGTPNPRRPPRPHPEGRRPASERRADAPERKPERANDNRIGASLSDLMAKYNKGLR
ncbi:MAG: helix-hairpin-helix domain-containing protein, partial [Holophaga sp.]|nr:helix-hairpin-helix domain-containing protein [Holophaga sp.]